MQGSVAIEPQGDFSCQRRRALCPCVIQERGTAGASLPLPSWVSPREEQKATVLLLPLDSRTVSNGGGGEGLCIGQCELKTWRYFVASSFTLLRTEPQA